MYYIVTDTGIRWALEYAGRNPQIMDTEPAPRPMHPAAAAAGIVSRLKTAPGQLYCVADIFSVADTPSYFNGAILL